MAPSRAIKLFGTEEPVGETTALSAGALEATLDSGNLRYIRIGGKEAIRAIAYLVRNKNWGTYNPEISNLMIDQNATGFTVTYDALCKDDEQSFRYSGADRRAERRVPHLLRRGGAPHRLHHQPHRLRGASSACRRGWRTVDGGACRRTHRREQVPRAGRSGLPVPRHPCADARDPAGPQSDMPHGGRHVRDGGPPQLDGRLLQDLCAPARASLALHAEEGREDFAKRDAEARRLRPKEAGRAGAARIDVSVGAPTGKELPRDRACRAGRASRKRSPMRISSRRQRRRSSSAISIRGRATTRRRCGSSPNLAQRSARSWCWRLSSRASMPRASQARRSPSCSATWQRSGKPPRPVEQSSRGSPSRPPPTSSTLPGSVFPPAPGWEDLNAAARKAFPGVPVGGGMFSYFTELNRKRPPAGLLDFIVHTGLPIVHAGDDVSMTETLEAAPSIFRSVRAFAGGKPYWVFPTAVGMRQTPMAPRPPKTREISARR